MFRHVKLARSWVLILAVILLGCQAIAPQHRARLEDESPVYLYLDPLAPEAGRLHVVIGGVAAIHRDGREFSFPVALRELKSGDARRQRLLAAGPLPAGDYAGLVFRTTSASLRSEDRGAESALLVPEAAARIAFDFTVRRREGAVLSMALKYAESLVSGFQFNPAFSVYSPEKPPTTLEGFIANGRSDDIIVFDKKSLRVFDVMPTGRGPSGMTLDQRARKLYVALSGEDAVDVFDVMSRKVADRVRLNAGDEPVDVVLTPDGTTLLSANRGSNTVSVIDSSSRFEMLRIPVGIGPRSIALDRTGRRAFVFTPQSNSVSVIDVPGRAPIRSIPTDPGPVRGQFNRRGDRLYVIHEIASYVTAINPATLTVIGRFPLRSMMDAIKVDPGSDLVYLASKREPAVGVYDPLSFVPIDFVATRGGVNNMATDAELNTLFLVSPAANRVIVSDRIRKRVVGELDVGDEPFGISVMGEN